MARWLVTGGSGVIGSCFARRMLEAGHYVDVIDSAEEPRNAWVERQLSDLGGSHVSFWKERVERTDREKLLLLLDAADAVLHAAASTGIPYSVESPVDDIARNIDSTRTLLEGLRECPKPTVILSSVKPYRITADTMARGLREDDPLDCDEPYAASKASQSLLAQAYAKSYNLPITVLRASNLYGPAPSHGPRHGWITWLCICAGIGRPLRVEGTGEQSRDGLHALDVASAATRTCAMLADEQQRQAVAGQIFNIGGGVANRISVNQLAKLLQELTGAVVVHAPGRAMDDLHVFADFTKFERATGWRPLVNIIDGVKEVLAWSQRHRADLIRMYEGV